jgi:peptidoglycan hydrolase-like protein with peptidoglycan-binding domain
MKRILKISLALTFVILVALGGWIAGSNIKSPAEAAARTAPPKASPILVPVEERVLTSNIVTRGTARFGLPQSISIAPSPLKPNAGVITTLPVRNTPLNEGDVMLTASGRPVFVLQGEVPAYRDLVPGLSGADILQLEHGLERLGFDPGPVDGTYDEQTGAAVAAWYTSAGFQPFGATADQLANIRALEQDLAVAINRRLTADDAAAAAPLAVDAAQANARAANRAAEVNVDAMTLDWRRIYGTWVSNEDQLLAEAQVSVAQTALAAAQMAGKAAIQAAVDAQAATEREAQTAADLVARLAADLETAQRDAGVKVPVDEIVFLSALPVRVEQSSVVLGDAASGPVLMVTNNQLAIDSSLPLDEAPLVKPGMAVAIDEPDLGITATGIVGRMADTPGTDGVDGFHIYLEIIVDEASTSFVGISFRLTIPIESSGGKVIAVPVSALSLAADGTSRVQVDNNGSLEFVVVEPGLSAGGFVQVTPVDGTLTPGQLVVVGYENKQ